jgi:SAM-dependent methyltransferase
MKSRTEIINFIAEIISAKDYLEIGVDDGKNFEAVECQNKLGVDPSPKSLSNIKKTSDDFFKSNIRYFDLIFIDGLHTQEQVKRDIENSLRFLRDGGIIVCHDMNPIKEEHQTETFNGSIWNGTCWKALVNLRQERSDLNIVTIDVDYGCSVIQKSNTPQKLLEKNLELTFENLNVNRKEWLNLITFEEFVQTMTKDDLNSLLLQFVEDSENPELSMSLALYYNEIGQHASAISYYLRAAERTEDNLLRYECLLKASECFEAQGTRRFTVKGMLQHAIALEPKRPEAYYLLSKMYSNENDSNVGKWFDSYLTSSIALSVCDFENLKPLSVSVDFPGKYSLLFQKAQSSWWCGLCDDSKELFLDLYHNYEMEENFEKATVNNLKFMGVEFEQTGTFAQYNSKKHKNLKIKFANSESIESNYSEAYQDMFVLTMLNGKKNGTYLEIGAGNTFYGNNTALLEKNFDWRGVSLDIIPEFVEAFSKERKNPCLLRDATTIDFSKFLNGQDFPKEIDYLQIDCDPPETSLKILMSIPFEEFKFAVITFEHDYYSDDSKMIRDKSRKFLESYGYVMVVGNVSPDDNRPFEDWWVHPDLVDISEISIDAPLPVIKAESYFLK